MNRKLFEIRKIGKTPVVLLLVTLLGIFAALFYWQFFQNSESNFLKFHGKTDYAPLNIKDKGFYGKVNSLLEKALEDKFDVEYDITQLDKIYKRLKFYYPNDTTSYSASVYDIRLIDFIPDSTDKEELAFYFNSDFRNTIEKQKRNLSQEYFHIEWDRAKTKILSITIDTTLFNLSLLNDSWKGSIKFIDPFSEVDPNVKYVITENNVIPLFSSNVDTTRFYNYMNQYDTISPIREKKYSIDEFEYLFQSLNNDNSEKSHVLLLNYHSANEKENECSIRFLNTKNRIFIQTQFVNLTLNIGGKQLSFVNDTAFALPTNFDWLKITLQLRNLTKKYSLYISKVSPFSIASKPLNGGVTSERLHIDTNYLDLFSLQQLRQLESGISNKDSIKSVTLSTNIILSKYLEQQIKAKVASLNKDKTFCLRPDDVFEMSVCLMDIATGEIIAAPFYSNEFEKNNIDEIANQRNFNLARHDIGSTFKPLISLAAYLKYPSLSDFQLLPATTYFIADTASVILGYPTIGYGFDRKTKTPNDLFWSKNSVGRQEFLSKSNDNFPVALSMIALTERGDPAYRFLASGKLNNTSINNLHQINGDVTSRINFSRKIRQPIFKDISNSSFVNLISNLYSVSPENKDSTYNTITYDTQPWDSLKTKKNVFFSLYPDIVYLGTDRFGNTNSGDPDFKKFELFVLGQGDNLWSNIKLAEAYSRLISKHKVNATFLATDSIKVPNLFLNPKSLFKSQSGDQYNFDVSRVSMENSWLSFMQDWEAAVKLKNPLLNTAYLNFNKGVKNFKDYHFYCKTGTPQENDEHSNNKVFKKGKTQVWWDEGVFVFGVTNNSIDYPKGVVGVVYIKHLTLQEVKKSVESSTARDFLTPEIFEKIMFYNKNRFK